jgi:hypothetical protein
MVELTSGLLSSRHSIFLILTVKVLFSPSPRKRGTHRDILEGTSVGSQIAWNRFSHGLGRWSLPYISDTHLRAKYHQSASKKGLRCDGDEDSFHGLLSVARNDAPRRQPGDTCLNFQVTSPTSEGRFTSTADAGILSMTSRLLYYVSGLSFRIQ